jgi:hypothetical protein
MMVPKSDFSKNAANCKKKSGSHGKVPTFAIPVLSPHFFRENRTGPSPESNKRKKGGNSGVAFAYAVILFAECYACEDFKRKEKLK